jgi:hypothetical protein
MFCIFGLFSFSGTAFGELQFSEQQKTQISENIKITAIHVVYGSIL